jgi:hypothetical protein
VLSVGELLLAFIKPIVSRLKHELPFETTGDVQANPPDDDDGGPPHTTFTERRYRDDRAPFLTAAYRRLIWPVRGAFPSAITVKSGTDDGGVPEPFPKPETGEWHTIASQSITGENFSCVEASLQTLDWTGSDRESPDIPLLTRGSWTRAARVVHDMRSTFPSFNGERAGGGDRMAATKKKPLSRKHDEARPSHHRRGRSAGSGIPLI